MLRLRLPQVRALDAGASADRRRRARQHLRRHFPDQVGSFPDDALDRFVRRCTAYAGRHGLSTMADLLRVLNLAVVFGEDFIERHDWMQQIMADDAFDHPADRLRFLHDQAVARLREAAPR